MKFDSQIIFFSVKDLQITSSFYENNFDFKLVLDQGQCRIYKTTADYYIGFCEKENVTVNENVVITFVTDEVDKVFKKLKEKVPDIEIVKEPALNERFKIYNGFVKDPDGYLIEIQRFESPEWKENK
ncbi:MAG TPA: VOC family protein [Ignavibacteria bacterium]|nr:VOC family protein [Ignavibacteria bacterium]HMR41290.1 VOC family protein [Ignavibacteria bacterium]